MLGYSGCLAPQPGRDVASAAADVASIANALGIDRFAVMGHSGGGPHALACAAVLPGRVRAAVCVSGLAPFGAEGLDWFAGMTPSGAAELRAAAAGRAALEGHFASAEFDLEMFTPADHAALSGPWSWIGTVVDQALASDQGGMVETTWPMSPRGVTTPGRSAPRSCSCTVPRTGSFPTRTRRGWRSAALRRTCG